MKDELLHSLARHGQEHVLVHWDKLNPAAQRELAAEIRGIDLEQLNQLYHSVASHQDWAALAKRAESPPAFRLAGHNAQFSPEEARQRGEATLARAEVGVVIVAGGQGTRLGFDHPKGMYPIGPVSEASLFQILIEQIVARARHYGVSIPLYLMTSDATHEETVAFLADNRNFGLPERDLHIFRQGTMPAVDARTGNILLAAPGHLSLSPDGHGGMLAALVRSGSLADAKRRGLRYLFYSQVDNPLAPICDPLFVGYHILAGSELSTLVVAKRTSREKVGNVVSIDGKLAIIEYSDLNHLPDEIVEKKTDQGEPVFWAGNTAIHVFNTEFLERMAHTAGSLPFHIARKAVAHIDEHGRRVEPKQPNAIKFERFIFDLLPHAEHGIVVEVDEERTFAPVKNAPGEKSQSPEIVRQQMVNLHREWLEQAGCRVEGDAPVEISPLFALDANELARKLPPGTVVRGPQYFR